MKIALTDRTLFGNEAAEDEQDDVFESYAVMRPEVTEFLEDKHPVAVVRAYKGEGKSALLRLVALRLMEKTVPPLIIRISSSAISPTIDDRDSDRWVRGWKENILRLAAKEIGSTISLAFNDDAISLVEEAEANGYKSRSFVSSVVDRLKSAPVQIERKRIGITNPEQILRRWSQKGAQVWFIIDDLDQNFENNALHRLRVATFFIALRMIANQIPEFRFRCSVRPNVWSIVKREFEALSHVEQYIFDLTWKLEDYTRLIARRVEGYLTRVGSWEEVKKTLPYDVTRRDKHLVGMIFDDPMPWGMDRDRPPASILYTLSRHRPRWLIELWRVSALSAEKAKHSKINFDDIEGQLESFGKRRVEDTVAEFKSQCPEIEELLVAFVNQPERFTTAELLSTLQKRILGAVNPRITDVIGKASPKEVAHFLYQIGFLTARKELNAENYEHISFAENPMLLSSRTNLDQGYSWEIHPVFRQALKLKNVPTRK